VHSSDFAAACRSLPSATDLPPLTHFGTGSANSRHQIMSYLPEKRQTSKHHPVMVRKSNGWRGGSLPEAYRC